MVYKFANSQTIMAVIALLSLLLCVQLSTSLISVPSARWLDKDPYIAASARKREIKHTPLDEVLADLGEKQLARARRQQSGPVTDGRYEFQDGYQYGIIHYSGEQSNVIFLLTYDLSNGIPTHTNLYRSIDYGSSFANIENRLDPSNPDPILYFQFYVSDFNKNMLVFPHATAAKLYFTLDEGTTFTTQEFDPPTINPRSLVWHPTRDRSILAHDSANDHLYVTDDLGANWKKIADYVALPSDFQWGVPEIDDDSHLVYFNTYDPDDQNRGDFTVNLYTQTEPYDESNRKEFDPNLGKHDGFLVVGPYIFAQKTDDAGVISLLVSHDRGAFKKALIPSTVPHQNYLVAHINSLQALVIVQHTSGQYNLYLSDITGIYYSLSLPDLVLENNALDLEMIEGLNGTFIANQYIRSTPTDTSVRTLISLDNGAVWDLVLAPALDVNGAPFHCEPPLCSLHFHMSSSEYARLGVFSQDTAPGIIIAHGTVGNKLAQNPDLFISRDGGVSWEETLVGSYGVAMMDFGGMIVAANDYHQSWSRVIKYSCDEGLSWSSFNFSSRNMIVFGVITEPGEHTTVVSLYGIESTSPVRWVVVTINLTRVFPRVCQPSDYYEWRPYDARTGKECILGSSTAIERRYADHCCLNGESYVRESNYTVCQCREDDFECDYGYERADEFSGICVEDPDVSLADPCVDGATTYTKSRGYRKIAGDVCTGGVEDQYLPYTASCCSDKATNSSTPPASPGGPTTSTSTPPTTSTSTPPTSTSTPPTTSTSTPPTPTTTTSTPTTTTTSTPPTTSTSTSPASSGGPTSNPKSSSNTGIVIGLAVMLALALVALAVFCVATTFLLWKNRKTRQRYIRAAAGDPQRVLFSFHDQSSDNDSEPEPLLRMGAHQDDDDDELLLP